MGDTVNYTVPAAAVIQDILVISVDVVPIPGNVGVQGLHKGSHFTVPLAGYGNNVISSAVAGEVKEHFFVQGSVGEIHDFDISTGSGLEIRFDGACRVGIGARHKQQRQRLTLVGQRVIRACVGRGLRGSRGGLGFCGLFGGAAPKQSQHHGQGQQQRQGLFHKYSSIFIFHA